MIQQGREKYNRWRMLKLFLLGVNEEEWKDTKNTENKLDKDKIQWNNNTTRREKYNRWWMLKLFLLGVNEEEWKDDKKKIKKIKKLEKNEIGEKQDKWRWKAKTTWKN